MRPQADIVIVNWNSGLLLERCVQSILDYPSGVAQIVVVDNGSSDGSADALPQAPNVRVERTGENLGFARACNLGAAHGTASYILFLNPDAAFLDGESLPRVLRFLEEPSSRDIGICGIRLVDETGATQASCANFTNVGTYLGQPFGLDRLAPSLFTPLFARFDYKESRDVDQAIGAFFIIRRTLFRQLAGFDNRFFVYYEEVDLCLRAREAGWRTHYFAESIAFHRGGGTSEQVKAKRLFYGLRSRIQYAFKHFGAFGAWLVLFVTLFIEPFSRLIRALFRRSLREMRETLEGYAMLIRQLPAILRGRSAGEPRP
jgi:N-acetylglucosaminyl-diphospho-decaprenol L-rhamnosyltransferase